MKIKRDGRGISREQDYRLDNTKRHILNAGVHLTKFWKQYPGVFTIEAIAGQIKSTIQKNTQNKI